MLRVQRENTEGGRKVKHTHTPLTYVQSHMISMLWGKAKPLFPALFYSHNPLSVALQEQSGFSKQDPLLCPLSIYTYV